MSKRHLLGLSLLVLVALSIWLLRYHVSPMAAPAVTPPETLTVMVGNTERSALIYTPAGADPASAPAALLVFHGGEGTGQKAMEQTDFTAYADAGQFLLVYPNSGGQQWNDGRAETAAFADDLAFFDAMVRELHAAYGVPLERIYVTGVSNGGMFAQWLVCHRSAHIRAAAPVVANLPVAAAPACAPQNALPLLFFHGTADRFMPFAGGEILHSGQRGVGGQVLSAADTMEFWRTKWACAAAPETRELAEQYPDDGVSVRYVAWPGCADDAALEEYQVVGGGHVWFGMEQDRRSARLLGLAGTELDAGATIVDFFNRYGLSNQAQ